MGKREIRVPAGRFVLGHWPDGTVLVWDPETLDVIAAARRPEPVGREGKRQ